ncbi:hypothetical protein VTL71DRAFT_6199 [Oculimacula yallundae]|uniref:Amidase domain-containing protein n=1 Tax=Oculimacula yallundae TaxID=86028 RepID=A0ABR4BZS9_9HELO
MTGAKSSSLAESPIQLPDLQDANLDSLINGLSECHFTSVDLVKVSKCCSALIKIAEGFEAYTARISEVQDDFHAILEMNPDAHRIASRLDAERARGPLHGIPILLKDLIATRDAMNTTAGSFALLGAKVPEDSTVARKLREAGAILLGKTSVSEWANFRSFNSSNGWSARSGQVYGPYYPHQDPWGSSSGSAVAAALGLAWACIGTETDGSIIRPASSNNVVGIKPTVGLTSRYLVIPVSSHLDTVGPLARTVKDAAHLLQAIAGEDSKDPLTADIPAISDYVKACKLSGLEGARIGVPRNAISLGSLPGYESAQTIAFQEALNVLRAAGAIIVDNADFTTAEEFWESPIPTQVVSADFLVDLPQYFNKLISNPNNITSLSTLREFVQKHPLEEYPDRDTALWDLTLAGFDSASPDFEPAYRKYLFYGAQGGLLGALEQYDLDAIVMPADYAAHHFAAPAKGPVVTVPMGAYPADYPITETPRGLIEAAEGIPFGISFLGRRWSEEKLIGMAYAFEQKTMWRERIKPYKSPTTDIEDVIRS